MPLEFLLTGIAGLLFGYIYGLSFTYQEKRVRNFFIKPSFNQYLFFLFPVLRLIFLGAIFVYLLHYQNINFILFFGCFALSFLLKIIKHQ